MTKAASIMRKISAFTEYGKKREEALANWSEGISQAFKNNTTKKEMYSDLSANSKKTKESFDNARAAHPIAGKLQLGIVDSWAHGHGAKRMENKANKVDPTKTRNPNSLWSRMNARSGHHEAKMYASAAEGHNFTAGLRAFGRSGEEALQRLKAKQAK